MRFCINCGRQLNDNAKFCPACGTGVNVNDNRKSYSQPPQQQYAPPQYVPPQQQYAPPQYVPPQQQYTPPQYVPPQQQYTPPQYVPPQQQYTPPQYAPPQQQYTPPQYAPPQQHAPNRQSNSGIYGNRYDYKLENDTEIRAFVKPKEDYYISKFRDMFLSGSNVSWNWAAFWFAGAWFAYRKMYGIAAMIVLASSVLSALPVPYVGSLSGLILNFFSGVLGNWFYKRYIDKEILNTTSMKPHDKAAYILQKGGTSIVGLIGMLAGSMILTKMFETVFAAI